MKNKIQRAIATFTAVSLLAASIPAQVWSFGGKAVIRSAPTSVNISVGSPTSLAAPISGVSLQSPIGGSLSLNSHTSLVIPTAIAIPGAQAPAKAAVVSRKSLLQNPAISPVSTPKAVHDKISAPKATLENAAAPKTTPQGRDFKSTAKRVGVALEIPGLKESAPAENSKAAGTKLFAALQGSSFRTASDGGLVPTGRALFSNTPRASQLNPAAQPLDVRPESVPQPHKAHPKAKAAPKHNWKTIGLVTAGLGLLAASPFLTAYAGVSAAAGSITLGIIGIPQIIRNFKLKKKGVGDLAIESTLIWFGGAAFISAVSIGQVVLSGAPLFSLSSPAFWWNLVNVLGVAQSLTILGQINYYRRTKSDLVKTLGTIAAVVTPLAMMAAGAFMPLTAWINVAFTAAMSLFLVLNFPQIRQNLHTWLTEGRIPDGVSPLYPLFVALGSAFHLYAAAVGWDVRWMFNAILAIAGSATVLTQIYAPATSNRVLRPIVIGAEKAVAWAEKNLSLSKKARLLRKARSELAAAFEGQNLLRHKGEDTKTQIETMVNAAGGLPGRSAIILQAPTAAGKSTLAVELGKKLGKRIKALEVDRYFKAIDSVPLDEDGHPDFDRPDSLHLEWVAEDIRALLRGETIELPAHDMASGTTNRKSGEFFKLGPKDVLVIDSIFASHDLILDAIGDKKSLNIHLFAPTVARLARRLARDTKLRGTSVAENLGRWPMILKNERVYIRPMRAQADLDINLMSEKELNNLHEAYAEILASAWAAHGESPELTKNLIEMIKASLDADR